MDPINIRTGIAIAGLMLVSAARLAAQDSIDKAEQKEATRLVRFLELPDRRAHAVDSLAKMGSAAVPALTRALDDPRLEVVIRVVLIQNLLGGRADAAVPTLLRLAENEDSKRGYAARWALAPFRPQGITVISVDGEGCIIELDSKGRKIHEIVGLPRASAAERLPNGNYLVAQAGLVTAAGRNGVVEVDRDGKVVWGYRKIDNCTSATRLPGGTTLIVSVSSGEVLEVDREGNRVWSFKTPKPSRAIRLANGNTLVSSSLQDLVMEVSSAGQIVWSWREKKSQPTDIQMLPSGNILVACYQNKEIVEVSSAGVVVHRLKVDFEPMCARRIANGHTIVGGRSVIEYDATGRRVWAIRGSAGTVRHY